MLLRSRGDTRGIAAIAAAAAFAKSELTSWLASAADLLSPHVGVTQCPLLGSAIASLEFMLLPRLSACIRWPKKRKAVHMLTAPVAPQAAPTANIIQLSR